MSHFQRLFGRNPNTPCSLTEDNLNLIAALDKEHLVRDALAAEERREPHDSHRSVKFEHKGESSRDLSPQFELKSSSIADTKQYTVLESPAKSASKWLAQKRWLPKEEGALALKALSNRNASGRLRPIDPQSKRQVNWKIFSYRNQIGSKFSEKI